MRPLSEYEISVGQVLHARVYDRSGKLLLESGHVVSSETSRAALIARGFVMDDSRLTRSGSAAEVRPVESTAVAVKKPSASTPWPDKPAAGLARVREELAVLTRSLGRPDEELGPALGEQIKGLAERLVRYVNQDPDCALAVMQLSSREDGPASRPVHAAILTELLARKLDLDEAESRSLVGAALTFDCTLSRLADVFNEQRADLTDEQRRAIQDHPICAVQSLQALGIDDPVWIDAVAQHHERMDGSGYPMGLRGEAISRGARIIALVDIYCALIRPRAYRGAVSATEAMRAIFLERGKLVDEALAASMIREVGVFPPGALVRMEKGEIGLVFRRGDTPGKPRVRLLLDRMGRPIADRPEHDSSTAGEGIAEALSAERYQGLLTGQIKLWE
jgi:HD-GYP domain-containing protein (c-di-GMP phosphodiesterase class II)